MHKIDNLNQVAQKITGENRLVFHAGVCEPYVIGQQLADCADLWPDLTIETFMPARVGAYVGDGRFKVESVMPGGVLRHAVHHAQVSILRESLYEHAASYANGRRRADIVVLQVGVPDADNMVCLGPCIGALPQMLGHARFVIAVLNQHLPNTSFRIPASRLDVILESDEPLASIEPAQTHASDYKIAENLLPLLHDNSTLEIGMGSTGDAVMQSLTAMKALHIHTGLVNDSLVPVVESGVLSRPVTTTLAQGSAGFHAWLDGNQQIDFRPVVETHDSRRLSQIPNFTAINAALQVDLAGNVNAERIGGRVISCPGGLPDFARGAQLSKGGRSIIVLRSTVGRHDKSTIVEKVDHTTLDGSLVDIIVTENGVATLTGLNDVQRAEAITSIAHREHQNLNI